MFGFKCWDLCSVGVLLRIVHSVSLGFLRVSVQGGI